MYTHSETGVMTIGKINLPNKICNNIALQVPIYITRQTSYVPYAVTAASIECNPFVGQPCPEAPPHRTIRKKPFGWYFH